MGLDWELMATESGVLYFLDQNTRRYARISVDPNEILGVARRLPAFFGQGQVYGTPIPDGFVDAVEYWEGDKVRALIIHTPIVDGLPKTLEEILEAIQRWFDRAMR